jgi:hypothetical protein
MAPAESACIPAPRGTPFAGPVVATSGTLLPNLLRLARALRALGMNVSAAQLADLGAALALVGLERRADVYHAARCVLARTRDEQALVDHALDLFFRLQGAELVEAEQLSRLGRRSGATLPENQETDRQARVREDLGPAPQDGCEEPEPEVRSTYSAAEILRQKDFDCYSEAELRAAKRFIDSLAWQLSRRPTRRRKPAAKEAALLDMRRTVRRSLAYEGELVSLAWRQRKTKPRPLTVICDISGSMERYSRLFLHFIFALAHGPQRAEAFVFGTRLTRITPALRASDVDRALDGVSGLVQDWSGGTRIGESLKTFNYQWSRRVLGRGAVAIVISDGWDRGDIDLLGREAARLQRSTHRLIWLNPLLGAANYQPLALGMRAVLPHVDDFLPLHNLASLESLALHLGHFLVAA